MKKLFLAVLAAVAVIGIAAESSAQVMVIEQVPIRTQKAALPNGGAVDSLTFSHASAGFDTTVAVSLEGLYYRGQYNAAADSSFAFSLQVSPSANPNLTTAIDSLSVYAQFSFNGRDWWDGTGGKSFVTLIGGGENVQRTFHTIGTTVFSGNSPMSAFAAANYVRFVLNMDFNGEAVCTVKKLVSDQWLANQRR